ncbi:MAG TPA: DegQ family serine endoprotease [Burkholderiales bacterium]
MKPSLRTRQIVIAIAAAGIGAGSALALQPRGAAPAATPPAVVSAAPMTLPDIASLVEQSSPAVVQITVTGKSDEGDAIADFGDEGPFGDFLKRFPLPRQMPDPDSRPSLGMGSGFILTPDGYIVTNQHVVGQADKVTVKLSDKREFDARIVGGDRHTDIALLKIDAANLPTVTLGNSDGVRVGQWVVAIGAPFGFDHSATQGIVSALSRSLPGDQYVPFIQTDVAVNPGNSGGPLFDLSGRVVGINSQIYSRTGGYMGLSFAIPINTAMSVVEQIRTSGRVERGWLGLVMQPVTRDLASSFGAEQPKGALISQVNEGGPAAEAGVKAGDIITAYDGKPVAESSDLPPLVGATKPGRKVPLTVWRGGRERTLEVKVGSLPDSGNTRVGQASPDGRGARLNVTVSDLTQEQRRQLGIEGGVLVNGVGNGAAKAAGMRPGDVILQVNGREVKDVAQFRDLVKDLPADRKLPMLVKRGEGAVFLAISLPPARG